MLQFRSLCCSLLSLLFISSLYQPLIAQNCPPTPQERVLLVGDSWSQFTHLYSSYHPAFTQYGYPDITVLGDRTAIGGTRASGWATPNNLLLITMELDSHPEIDLVILCVGGNDMVAGNGWRKSMTQAQRDTVFDRVQANIETIIDHIYTLRPDMNILLGGYDYMNFVESILNYPAGSTNPYESMWNTLENPDPEEVNLGLGELESRKIAIANADPQVQYVNTLGLNHYIYGYPDTLPIPPFGTFAPQQTPLPGQAPNYLPLNGGNPSYPSPQVAMGAIVPGLNILPGFDCIHMNEESYGHYARHQTRYALLDWLKGDPDHSFVSEGGNQDGWANTNGQLGNQNILTGTDSSVFKTVGFISFATDSLIPNKQIGKASIFLTRDSLEGINPFKQGLRLDMISGIWGNSPDVEAMDITAQADLEDVACILTTAMADGYVVRMDLKNEALLLLNSGGYTQFRLVVEDSMIGRSSMISLLTGDQNGPAEPPRLDVFYGVPPVPTSTPPLQEPLALQIYPNPTEKMLFFHLKGQKSSKFAYSLRDINGKLIYYVEEASVPFEETVSLDLSTLPTGLYLLRVQHEDYQWVRKILKK